MPKGVLREDFDLETYKLLQTMDILSGKRSDAFRIYRKRRKKRLAIKHRKHTGRCRHARRKSEIM